MKMPLKFSKNYFVLTVNKIIIVLYSLIFSILFMEIIIRLVPVLRSQVQLSRYALEGEDIDKVEGLNRFYRQAGFYLYRPSEIPGLGYELVPGVQAEQRVNAYGMVCKEYPINKKENVYRILVLGDSVTQEYSFVKSLEAMLNEKCPKPVFELWNAGVGGYAVNQYAAYLKYKGLKYSPDMVIVDFCMNDLGTETIIYFETKKGVIGYNNAGYQLSKTFPLNKWSYLHSFFYRFLVIKSEQLFFPEKNLSYGKTEASRPTEGRYYLKQIRDICAQHNIPLFVVVFPYLKPLAEYTNEEKQVRAAIINSLQEFSINFIDLHEYIPDDIRHTLRSNIKFSPDYAHFTPEGYKLAAAAVFNRLAKNYFKKECAKK